MLAIIRAQITINLGITMDEIKPYEASYKGQNSNLSSGDHGTNILQSGYELSRVIAI